MRFLLKIHSLQKSNVKSKFFCFFCKYFLSPVIMLLNVLMRIFIWKLVRMFVWMLVQKSTMEYITATNSNQLYVLLHFQTRSIFILYDAVFNLQWDRATEFREINKALNLKKVHTYFSNIYRYHMYQSLHIFGVRKTK